MASTTTSVPTTQSFDAGFPVRTEIAPGMYVHNVNVSRDGYNMNQVISVEIVASGMVDQSSISLLLSNLRALMHAGTYTLTSSSTNVSLPPDAYPEQDDDEEEFIDEIDADAPDVMLRDLREMLEQRLDDIDQALRLLVEG